MHTKSLVEWRLFGLQPILKFLKRISNIVSDMDIHAGDFLRRHPGIGDPVVILEMGGCMGHIERDRVEGRVIAQKSWKTEGSIRAYDFVLVETKGGQQSWQPAADFYREKGLFVRRR